MVENPNKHKDSFPSGSIVLLISKRALDTQKGCCRWIDRLLLYAMLINQLNNFL